VEVNEIAGARSYADVVETYAPALLRLAVARSVHRRERGWPAYLAVAAAVVVVALVGAFLVSGRDAAGPPITEPTPPPTASTATYQENRALAAAESARVVRLVRCRSRPRRSRRSRKPGRRTAPSSDRRTAR
jgi:hypothetical protein